MKKNEFVVIVLALMMMAISLPAMAKGDSSSKNAAAYGPESKRIGAGIYLGEPIGFTVKGYVTEKFAIDGIAAWGFRDKAFTVIGDVTYDCLDIPIDSDVATFPFYAGAGAKVEFKAGPNDDTMVGVRIPVGVAAQWRNYPIEMFVELAPGVGVVPSTRFDITGGIGARFYF